MEKSIRSVPAFQSFRRFLPRELNLFASKAPVSKTRPHGQTDLLFLLVFSPLLFVSLFLAAPQKAQAWGARGHSTICEAAIHLVSDKGLKSYLMGKVQSLTYLCNLPDTYWRGLKEASSGTSSHFFETDPTELSFEKVPLDYKTFEDWAAGQKNKFKDKPILFPAKELGSSWWRADQFYRRALAAAKEASSKTNSDPQHSKELFEMVAMMGLMGHFIGDISQPLHNTSNYDGWSNGHGGLHGYFETELVNQLPPSLLADIVARGPVAKKELSLETKKSRVLLEQLQALAVLSFSELEKLWVLDPLLKKSDLQSKKGLELKSPAQRKDPALAAGAFRKIIIGEMARSAVLLAATWDRIYKEGHSPDLKSDRSFDFPHQYPFIPPDYVSRKDL